VPGLLALVGAVGPLLYVLLVTVLGLLWEGYDPVRDSMSELGGVESPHGPLMNVAGFVAVGVSILAFAAAYQLLLPRGAWKAVAAGLLVVAGVFMVVVGFFPCDAGCVDVTRTGTLHSITSTPQAIALPLAAMASAFVFGSDRRFGTAWQAFSGWAGLVSLGTGPLVAAGSLAAVTGLVQRAGIGLSLLWMTAVSIKLHVLTRAERAPDQGATSPGGRRRRRAR
jgi:hypothetical membrane protein